MARDVYMFSQPRKKCVSTYPVCYPGVYPTGYPRYYPEFYPDTFLDTFPGQVRPKFRNARYGQRVWTSGPPGQVAQNAAQRSIRVDGQPESINFNSNSTSFHKQIFFPNIIRF